MAEAPDTGIAFYRKKQGLSQKALAEKLGIDETWMSRLESGVLIPTSTQVDQLADILETPPSRLFSKNILAEVADRSRAGAA